MVAKLESVPVAPLPRAFEFALARLTLLCWRLQYSIGYLALSTAQEAKISVVDMVNRAGFVVSAGPESVAFAAMGTLTCCLVSLSLTLGGVLQSVVALRSRTTARASISLTAAATEPGPSLATREHHNCAPLLIKP
jgi:hypothetical protein